MMRLYSAIRSVNWLYSRYPAASCKALLEKSQAWSSNELEDFQNHKLRQLIRHCYETVPYYRRVMERERVKPDDIRIAADLAKLPILTKDAIRTHVHGLLSKDVPLMRSSWSQTGGTTGEPIRICKNVEANAWAGMCHERGLAWGGLGHDEPRIRLFGGSLGIAKTKLPQRIGEQLRGDVFLPAFELGSGNARSYFDAIRKSKARVLIGYTSAIYNLAKLAQDLSEDIRIPVVFPTAEDLPKEWEETIRKAFRCEVRPYYGCGEVNALGYQRPGDGFYSIPGEHVLIEVMHCDGVTSITGEGRFLLTDLDNRAMPIIRYLNGDAGRIDPSAGKAPFAQIPRLDGRYNSLLMTERGDFLSGAIGAHIFRYVRSVKRYQIIQEEPLRIVVKMMPEGQLSEDDKHLVVRLLTRYLGERMRVTIETVDDIPIPPSGKMIFVINRCI
jgi:phenylacetate-CoA ligase